MSVDLKALKEISQGDPVGKVMVTRKWLAEVHRLLVKAETDKHLGGIGKILKDAADAGLMGRR